MSPPSRPTRTILLLCVSALVLSACGDSAKLPEDATIGPNPTLPEPRTSLIPTVDIAPAKGWPGSAPCRHRRAGLP